MYNLESYPSMLKQGDFISQHERTGSRDYCEAEEIEEECYFLLQCEKYNDIRTRPAAILIHLIILPDPQDVYCQMF